MRFSNEKARNIYPFALRFQKLFPLFAFSSAASLQSSRYAPHSSGSFPEDIFGSVESRAFAQRTPLCISFSLRAKNFPQDVLTGRRIPSEVISRRYRLNSFGAIKDAPYDSFACRLAAAAVNLKIFKSACRKKYCRLRAGKRRIPFPRLFNGASFRPPLNVSPSQADVFLSRDAD